MGFLFDSDRYFIIYLLYSRLWRKLLNVINFVTVSIIVKERVKHFDSCDGRLWSDSYVLVVKGLKFSFNLFIPAVNTYLPLNQTIILSYDSLHSIEKLTKEIRKQRTESQKCNEIFSFFHCWRVHQTSSLLKTKILHKKDIHESFRMKVKFLQETLPTIQDPQNVFRWPADQERFKLHSNLIISSFLLDLRCSLRLKIFRQAVKQIVKIGWNS